jgi:hypothetical protein
MASIGEQKGYASHSLLFSMKTLLDAFERDVPVLYFDGCVY